MYPFSSMAKDLESYLDAEIKMRPTHIFDSLDATAEQQNEDDAKEAEPIDTNVYPCEEDSLNTHTNQESKFKPILLKDDEQLKHDARCLSFEQKIIFDKIISWCSQIAMIKESSNQPDPIRIIAHGKHIPVVYYIYINILKVY